jgi:alpha-tubulin suppressor-like RCC1 family protein
VVQIACGSQHNLLRVLSETDTNVGECWVFGNGALGQLGLGRKVTGRRTPVHLPIQDDHMINADGGGGEDSRVAILNVIDIAAGANHSVCVCRNENGQGGVFSWGHGECK